MDSSNNLILSHQKRLARKEQKLEAVLRFLRQHIWSTQEILQKVIDVESRQATHKTLVSLEKNGVIRRHTYSALGGDVTIWGITFQGQALAFNPISETIISTYFEPSRISEQTIRHQLDIQKLRLKAEAAGWNGWIDGDRVGNSDKDLKRPDAICINPTNQKVAVECERTFKSLKRYEQVLINYLRLIKSGEIDHVIWVCPSKEMAVRLKSIITSIQFVRISGQRIKIEPSKHHVNLFFCSYDEWPFFYEQLL